jgi:ABC-type branched-subunit amino acid transport system substrate-binding protein
MLILTGCDRILPRPGDPVVKVGLVAPFEGKYRDVGYDVIYSARLAIREANQERGPGQTKVALVAVDDFGSPESAQQMARAMVIDPEVVAVIGHWRAETTAAAKSIYAAAGMPFVSAGQSPFGATDPAALDAGFLRAYEDVTPFDESAGPFAGTAYDGMQLILSALAEIEDSGSEINRATVEETLQDYRYEGITGTVQSN